MNSVIAKIRFTSAKSSSVAAKLSTVVARFRFELHTYQIQSLSRYISLFLYCIVVKNVKSYVLLQIEVAFLHVDMKIKKGKSTF